MSIGVQSSGINISHAELSRLVDAGKSEPVSYTHL